MTDWKRWLWFLTVEERSPMLFRAGPFGEHAWRCNPQHTAYFAAHGVPVLPDPYCPLWSRRRRWLWEKC